MKYIESEFSRFIVSSILRAEARGTFNHSCLICWQYTNPLSWGFKYVERGVFKSAILERNVFKREGSNLEAAMKLTLLFLEMLKRFFSWARTAYNQCDITCSLRYPQIPRLRVMWGEMIWCAYYLRSDNSHPSKFSKDGLFASFYFAKLGISKEDL